MATRSSTLAWQIPWTGEPGRLQSMGSLEVGYNWATSLSLFTFMHWRRKWQPTPVFLPGESQGRGSLLGCRLWGRRVGHDWSDLAAAAAGLLYLKGDEQIVSITNYQRNANQNYNEALPKQVTTAISQKIYKQYILERVWRKGNPPTLLVGM